MQPIRLALTTLCLSAVPLSPFVALSPQAIAQSLPPGFTQDVTGTYGSRTVLADGYTHTETANVSGGRVELLHEFVSRDGRSRGSFRWKGTYTMTGPASATAAGQGVIDNLGQRNFSVSEATIRYDASGMPQLCWKATDPQFGAIGGCSQRQSAIVNAQVQIPPASSPVESMPVPVPAPPTVVPAPAPIAPPVPVAPAPAPVAPAPAPIALPTPMPTPVPLPVPAPGVADIVVTSVAVIPPQPSAGSQFLVRATVLNKGNVDVTNTWLLSGSGGFAIGPQSVSTRAGTTGTLDIPVTLPSPGSQTLTLHLARGTSVQPQPGVPWERLSAWTQRHQVVANVQGTAAPAPVPRPVPLPMPVPAPTPAPAAFDFTGSYAPVTNGRAASNFTLAVVKGDEVSLQHELVNLVSQKHLAIYRWSGRLARNPNGSASFSGQGTAEDASGTRAFTVTRGRLVNQVRSDVINNRRWDETSICWSGSDPGSKEFPKGEIPEQCSTRNLTNVIGLPRLAPIAVAPAPTPVPTPSPMPPSAPGTTDFTGTYRSQTVLPDGFTHTETATVNGTTVNLIHQFVSKDGKSGGNFRWTGTLSRGPDGSGVVRGQGMIDNLGQRNFVLGETTVRMSGNVVTLCWKATDPKFGAIGGCSQRQGNAVSALPQPIVFAPMPSPGPAVAEFTGSYRSQTVLPDGFTHTERAAVNGSSVNLLHEFVSKDGKTRGSFRWTGTASRNPDGSASLKGQGVIDNIGQRNFALTEGSLRSTGGGGASLCWKANDPKFGAIGGCTQRQTTSVSPIPN